MPTTVWCKVSRDWVDTFVDCDVSFKLNVWLPPCIRVIVYENYYSSRTQITRHLKLIKTKQGYLSNDFFFQISSPIACWNLVESPMASQVTHFSFKPAVHFWHSWSSKLPCPANLWHLLPPISVHNLLQVTTGKFTVHTHMSYCPYGYWKPTVHQQ